MSESPPTTSHRLSFRRCTDGMPEQPEDRPPRGMGGLSAGAVARRTGEPCTLCNRHHRQANGTPSCNGHRSKIRPYVPCASAPIAGGEVCRMHGGSITSVKEAAARRASWEAAQGGIARLLQECDLPEQHPIDGLLEVVRHSGAMMRLLGYVVGGLEIDDDAKNIKKLVGYNHLSDQSANAYVGLYAEWADRYARACKLALDANIDERLVRNAEATTGVFLTAFEEALADAELDPAQAARFAKTLADKLRKVGGPLDVRAHLEALL